VRGRTGPYVRMLSKDLHSRNSIWICLWSAEPGPESVAVFLKPLPDSFARRQSMCPWISGMYRASRTPSILPAPHRRSASMNRMLIGSCPHCPIGILAALRIERSLKRTISNGSLPDTPSLRHSEDTVSRRPWNRSVKERAFTPFSTSHHQGWISIVAGL